MLVLDVQTYMSSHNGKESQLSFNWDFGILPFSSRTNNMDQNFYFVNSKQVKRFCKRLCYYIHFCRLQTRFLLISFGNKKKKILFWKMLEISTYFLHLHFEKKKFLAEIQNYKFEKNYIRYSLLEEGFRLK